MKFDLFPRYTKYKRDSATLAVLNRSALKGMGYPEGHTSISHKKVADEYAAYRETIEYTIIVMFLLLREEVLKSRLYRRFRGS